MFDTVGGRGKERERPGEGRRGVQRIGQRERVVGAAGQDRSCGTQGRREKSLALTSSFKKKSEGASPPENRKR